MRRRIVQNVLIVTAVVVFAVIVWAARREHKLAIAFQNMQKPTGDSVEGGGLWAGFGGNTPQECKEEYIYASPYARIIPRYWAFRFDERGRLIDKYEYQSP
jgi:hypothetical protein